MKTLILDMLKPICAGIALSIAIGATGLVNNSIHTVRAFGDLSVQFGIPAETPLFNLTNMAPGDMVTKSVVVTNNGAKNHIVAVKGVKTSADSSVTLEDVMRLKISAGSTVLFQNTLSEFFSQSTSENGITLTILSPTEDETYEFEITFLPDADNTYQGQSVIFDLTFGTVEEATTETSLVLNEVYYRVDGTKGYDSPKDRGINAVNGNNVSVIISDNGAGSINTVNISLKDICKITQGNNVNITNVVNQNGNTGGNTNSSNSGSSSTQTGFVSQVLNIVNFSGINIGSCGNKLGQNHEWVELYNPTNERINLKGWTLTDNSGNSVQLKNKKVDPGEFVLVTKDSATWKYWNEGDAIKMNLGSQIGDGLDNGGDHLILKNKDGNVIDTIAWGDDTAIWNPAVPDAAAGASLERVILGADTDEPADWDDQLPPTPGN